MAEEQINSITDAIELNAMGIAKRVREGQRERETEHHSLEDMIAADRYVKGNRAAARGGGVGIRRTKLIPPGGG